MAYKLGGLDTSHISTGEFADARISETSTTQHEAAMEPLLQLNKLGIDDNVVLGSFLISSDLDPVGDADFARKAYVDGVTGVVDLALQNFQSAQADVDAGQDGAIADEAARAQEAEQQNASDIAGAISAHDAYVASNNTALAADVAALAQLRSEYDALTSGLDNEALDQIIEVIAAYEGADSDLQASITALSTAQSSALAQAIADFQAADTAMAADYAALVASEAVQRADGDTAEAAARTAADDALQVAIDAEAATRLAADQNFSDDLGGVMDDLAAEATARADADTGLAGDIAAEASTARAAEQANAAAISAEAATRAAAVEGLQGADASMASSIEDLQAADENHDGQIADLVSDLASEASTARAAEQANATAISNEASTARAAEVANANAISAEAVTARAAEGANAQAIEDLQSDMADDVAALAAYQSSNDIAVAANASAIAAETTARTSAVSGLQGQLDAVLDSGESLNQVSEMLAAWTSADNSVLTQVQTVLDQHDSDMTAAEASIATNASGVAANAQSIVDSDAASVAFRARADNPHSVSAAQLGLVIGSDTQAHSGHLDGVAQGDYSGQGMKVGVYIAGQGEQYAMGSSDYFVVALAGSQITLPAPEAGRKLVVKTALLGGGQVSIIPNGGQVDGNGDGMSLTYDYSAVSFISDGTDWWIC